MRETYMCKILYDTSTPSEGNLATLTCKELPSAGNIRNSTGLRNLFVMSKKMAYIQPYDIFSSNIHGFESNGLFNYPGTVNALPDYGWQRSKEPITTASSVLGIRFQDGIIIAADMLGSYGTLARFRDCSRVFKVNKHILVGAGGDYADFQYLKEIIMQKVIDEECIDDGFHMKPKALYHWLTRVLYSRRTQLDPLWNNYVIGGIQNGEPFLGSVDKLGTAFLDEHIATGFGAYLAIPIMRDAFEKASLSGGLTKDEAMKLIFKCIEVLYYRDAKSWPKFEIGIITKDEVKVEGPFTIKGNWDIASAVQGYE